MAIRNRMEPGAPRQALPYAFPMIPVEEMMDHHIVSELYKMNLSVAPVKRQFFSGKVLTKCPPIFSAFGINH